MTTISYAQNFEDVMLLRALAQIPRGFYIDVGAQHPVHGSVTKAFYERGWRGINIEPVAQWFDEVVKDRPEDVNLKIAISSAGKEMELFEIPDTGLSTTAGHYAEKHREEGRAVVRRIVPCRSLDEVIAEYGGGDIHFLKVDVEGAEGSVLESLSLDRHRPWIMVVEATEPNSQHPAYQEWEPRVLASGYEMVYEDGLNRFYLARERAELKEAFRLPPNYFDSFVLYSDWCIKNELDVRTRELDASRETAQALHDGAVLGELRQRLFQQRAMHRLAGRRQRQLQAERDQQNERESVMAEELHALQLQRGQQNEREHAMTEELHALRLQRDQLAVQLDQSIQALGVASVELERLRPCEQAMMLAESELALIKRSRSWRLTRPLRVIRPGLGWRGTARRGVRAMCKRTARILVRLPGARPTARILLSRHPQLKQRLVTLMYGPRVPQVEGLDNLPVAVGAEVGVDQHDDLSRSASEALELLRQRRDSKHKASQGHAA